MQRVKRLRTEEETQEEDLQQLATCDVNAVSSLLERVSISTEDVGEELRTYIPRFSLPHMLNKVARSFALYNFLLGTDGGKLHRVLNNVDSSYAIISGVYVTSIIPEPRYEDYSYKYKHLGLTGIRRACAEHENDMIIYNENREEHPSLEIILSHINTLNVSYLLTLLRSEGFPVLTYRGKIHIHHTDPNTIVSQIRTLRSLENMRSILLDMCTQ